LGQQELKRERGKRKDCLCESVRKEAKAEPTTGDPDAHQIGDEKICGLSALGKHYHLEASLHFSMSSVLAIVFLLLLLLLACMCFGTALLAIVSVN